MGEILPFRRPETTTHRQNPIWETTTPSDENIIGFVKEKYTPVLCCSPGCENEADLCVIYEPLMGEDTVIENYCANHLYTKKAAPI